MTRLNKIKYVIVAAVMLGTLGACKKTFLDLDPPTSVPLGAAFRSEADMLVALRGAYQSLRAVDHWGRTVPVAGDLYADNIYVSVQNSGRYIAFNNYSITVADGNVAGMWGTAYTAILRANNIINASLPSSANVDQYKGEAYAIRALCHFMLVRWFARPYTDGPNGLGIPVVTAYSPDAKPARNTVGEVYTQILNDLTQAYNLMTMFTNSSQFSKYAAKALQAKVYMTMGDKTNAKAAALDVINNSGFTLVSAANYVSYWTSPAIRTDRVETLFEVSSDAVGNNAFDALSYIYTQGGYGDMMASDELYALYEASDVRRNLLTPGVRGGAPSVFVGKYPAISGDRSDTKILRLSEMYLIAAEASLPANEADALTYVNAITSRRNATPIASTGAALLEDVITERRKELAFEGDRYMDLMRLMREVDRSNNYPAAARNIPYSDFRRVLPIPQGEMDANPNMVQNPGW